MLAPVHLNLLPWGCQSGVVSSSLHGDIIPCQFVFAMYRLRQSSSVFCTPGAGTLITPIAPHSLSFRPLVVPESSEIVVHLPLSGPSHARCADGSSTLCKQACRHPTTLCIELWDADCLLNSSIENQTHQGNWQWMPKNCKGAVCMPALSHYAAGYMHFGTGMTVKCLSGTSMPQELGCTKNWAAPAAGSTPAPFGCWATLCVLIVSALLTQKPSSCTCCDKPALVIHCRASFDGRHTMRLPRGSAIRCTTSKCALPMVSLGYLDRDW